MRKAQGARHEARDEDQGSYLRAGHSPDILRKLRRGEWPVRDEIDLHGLTVHEASLATAAFLEEARAHGLRCVRVVHGKGLRSAGGESVLKQAIRRLLAHAQGVLAFVEPPPAQGGSGAVVVLLDA